MCSGNAGSCGIFPRWWLKNFFATRHLENVPQLPAFPVRIN